MLAETFCKDTTTLVTDMILTCGAVLLMSHITASVTDGVGFETALTKNRRLTFLSRQRCCKSRPQTGQFWFARLRMTQRNQALDNCNYPRRLERRVA